MEAPLPRQIALDEGEIRRATYRPDRAQYWRDMAMSAALAMALGMGVLWAIGNPHIWTGAVGGLAAIALRAGYLASEELAAEWVLTDRRLLGPRGPVPLSGIAKVRLLGTAVQIITLGGDKHLIKFQPDRAAIRDEIDQARRAAQ